MPVNAEQFVFYSTEEINHYFYSIVLFRKTVEPSKNYSLFYRLVVSDESETSEQRKVETQQQKLKKSKHNKKRAPLCWADAVDSAND